MKANQIVFSFVVSFVFVASLFGQSKKPVIFAVMNDGKLVEPIAFVEKGKLTPAIREDVSDSARVGFGADYYKPGEQYRLYFAGRDNGTVTVKRFNADSDCAPNMAEIAVDTKRTELKGFLMALATNFKPSTQAKDVRRRPTAAERKQVEELAKGVFQKDGVTQAALAKINYLNLTAIDADHDGKAEIVGSFYVAPNSKERKLLFVIAEKGSNGSYYLAQSRLASYDQNNVMNGEVNTLDSGVYSELLLDSIDYDNDRSNEIFTYTQGFEGSNFAVYKKKGRSWQKVFETSNYHCGY
ncbi:MAG: hypothetical protein ACK5NT_10850 [Pyrinomonadaceae bacterium]